MSPDQLALLTFVVGGVVLFGGILAMFAKFFRQVPQGQALIVTQVRGEPAVTFTGAVVRSYTSDNIVRVLTEPVFRTATLRTVGIALAVTVICMALAVPLALYMAKIASPRVRLARVVAVTTPLWASYLVKA